MRGPGAIDVALDLARMPSLAPAMRRADLPSDVLVLIRLAAGCEDTIRDAVAASGKPAAQLSEAAVLYLQQIVLHPQADSHRLLAVAPGASREQLRQHRTWLLRWLHPDVNRNEWETVFAERVIGAWSDLSGEKEHDPGTLPARDQIFQIFVPWIKRPVVTPRIASRRRGKTLIKLTGLGIAASLLALFVRQAQVEPARCAELGERLDMELRAITPVSEEAVAAESCSEPARTGMAADAQSVAAAGSGCRGVGSENPGQAAPGVGCPEKSGPDGNVP